MSDRTGAVANPASREIRLLVASAREWFVMALEAVLQPVGFDITRARSDGSLLEAIGEGAPDILVLDDTLPGLPIPELCRRLANGGLPAEVPVALYSASALSNEAMLAEALEAGAWAILPEPMRASRLLAELRRLVAIGRSLSGRTATIAERSDRAVVSGEEMERLLPFLAALAERQRARLSYVVVGLTRPGGWASGAGPSTLELALRHTRRADLWAVLEEGDLAVMAYDTTAAGASRLVERLNAVAAEHEDLGSGADVLSAGVVELLAEGEWGEEQRGAQGRAAARVPGDLLSAARAAFLEARAGGGGVGYVQRV